MNQILELREKRAKAWDAAKAFLDSKRGADGKWKFASRVMGSRCAGDVSHHQKAFDPSCFGAENTLYPKVIRDFVL